MNHALAGDFLPRLHPVEGVPLPVVANVAHYGWLAVEKYTGQYVGHLLKLHKGSAFGVVEFDLHQVEPGRVKFSQHQEKQGSDCKGKPHGYSFIHRHGINGLQCDDAYMNRNAYPLRSLRKAG